MAEAAPDAVTEDDREALAVQAYPDGEYTSVATNLALREAFLRGYEARAAVPDAATELAQLRAERDAGKQAEADRAYLYQLGLKLGAERDAALAAIERVQETLSLHNPNGRLVKEVLAALDGAPEPEVLPVEGEPSGDPHEMSEHSVVAYHEWRNILGRDHLSDDEGTAARIAFYAGWDHARAVTPEPDWEYGLRTRSKHDPARGFFSYAGDLETAWEMYGATYEHCTATIVRRRKAGPWLPVEGEGKL